MICIRKDVNKKIPGLITPEFSLPMPHKPRGRSHKRPVYGVYFPNLPHETAIPFTGQTRRKDPSPLRINSKY
jgi:hypothetical protein